MTKSSRWNGEEHRLGTETPGKGALPEHDGRCFMALLDMCHFLVDGITQRHNFASVEESSMLRTTNTRACALLTAECYSYWYSTPAGPGIFEMLCDWTKREEAVAMTTDPPGFVAALHALAVNECAQWPRRRKTGTFFYAGDDETGAALMADESLEEVYRVVGLSTSIGDMLRSQGQGFAEAGSMLRLTLLPWMGRIVYDGTLMGGPSLGSTDPSLVVRLGELATSARAGGDVIAELPAVADAPFLGKRVAVRGLIARPELNGRVGFAGSFDDVGGRYAVSLEDGGGSFKIRPDNLAVAPSPRAGTDGAGAAAAPPSERDVKLQRRILSLPRREDFWVCRRMGYTEAENPMHMGVIMSGKSGMTLGTLQSRDLAPTPAEYLSSLEAALFGGKSSSTRGGGVGFRPSFFAVDEQSAVDGLKAVLSPAGIQVGYYPPPSNEELAAMGMGIN
jgi:hypothetical protein